MSDLTWPQPGPASEQNMQNKALSVWMEWHPKSLKDYINELILIFLQTTGTCYESGSSIIPAVCEILFYALSVNKETRNI